MSHRSVEWRDTVSLPCRAASAGRGRTESLRSRHQPPGSHDEPSIRRVEGHCLAPLPGGFSGPRKDGVPPLSTPASGQPR
ncbi:hypothetical protein GDO81_021154 [Engystomops pustulosus]|uniref:Uncharacterized protein n=1 Tax=Engystomops pustulosus TaxID=76066 RepID=A0AAV6YVQ5_ENGPU|nr:hypothetical protein GDO81_021154 [Engystomops pustulosus]KAG8539265.1 hypothetical protein GDO81_021154 [Engystomops pustulosus]